MFLTLGLVWWWYRWHANRFSKCPLNYIKRYSTKGYFAESCASFWYSSCNSRHFNISFWKQNCRKFINLESQPWTYGGLWHQENFSSHIYAIKKFCSRSLLFTVPGGKEDRTIFFANHKSCCWSSSESHLKKGIKVSDMAGYNKIMSEGPSLEQKCPWGRTKVWNELVSKSPSSFYMESYWFTFSCRCHFEIVQWWAHQNLGFDAWPSFLCTDSSCFLKFSKNIQLICF